MHLKDKVALVAGGTGEVGEGILRELVASGAEVIVPSRSEQRLADLRERLTPSERGSIHGHGCAIGTHKGAESLLGFVESEFGQLDFVVASLGASLRPTSLVELPAKAWWRVLEDGLTTHFMLLKHFLPLISRSRGSYLFINGAAAHTVVPGKGPISIVSAAQLMLKDVAAMEVGDSGARVNTLVLETPVRTAARDRALASWLTDAEVGCYAVALLADPKLHGQTIRLDRAAYERTLRRAG